MEYYYSGTESLWCGNWNHLVCRRWKCEVDHPSQSTVVNLGKKQKLCSLWCLWSQVQQDTSCPDNFRILGCLWTIHHRCTCKRDAKCFFPVESKDCMKSASYEYRKMSANGNHRYKCLVLGHEEAYFVKEHLDSISKYIEDDIIKMTSSRCSNFW